MRTVNEYLNNINSFSFFLFLLYLTVQSQNTSAQCLTLTDSLTQKEVYILVDRMPEVKGGENKIYEEMKKKLIYPSELGNIDSKIIIGFIVDSNGKISGKRIISDINGTDLGKQLLLLLDNLKWIPGKCNDKNVSVLYKLPIRICVK